MSRNDYVNALQGIVADRNKFSTEEWKTCVYPEAIALQKQTKSRTPAVFPPAVWSFVKGFLFDENILVTLLKFLPKVNGQKKEDLLERLYVKWVRFELFANEIKPSPAPSVTNLTPFEEEKLARIMCYKRIYKNKNLENEENLREELGIVCPITGDCDNELMVENIKFYLKNGHTMQCAGQYCESNLWDTYFTNRTCRRYGDHGHYHPICVDCDKHYLDEKENVYN